MSKSLRYTLVNDYVENELEFDDKSSLAIPIRFPKPLIKFNPRGGKNSRNNLYDVMAFLCNSGCTKLYVIGPTFFLLRICVSPYYHNVVRSAITQKCHNIIQVISRIFTSSRVEFINGLGNLIGIARLDLSSNSSSFST